MVAVFAGLLVSCSPPQEQSERVALSESQAEAVEAQGLRFQAMAYADPASAESVFGFDIRGAGLLPLRLSVQNRGTDTVRLIPSLTFLIDQEGRAWPLLTSGQAAIRLGRVPEQPPPPNRQERVGKDSFTAFAFDLVTGPGFPQDAPPRLPNKDPVSQTFAAKGLRNPGILAGQLASALLFFPGSQASQGVSGLRIGYEQAGRQAFLTLPLKTRSISAQ